MKNTRRRGRPAHDDILTPAEWRVVDWVRHGLSNRQIAERRGTSVDAVKFHVANALGKLGLPNRLFLRRWRGAPRASPVNTRRDSMTMETRLGAIGQIARTTSDIKKAEAWYRDVLGLVHLYTFDTLAFFDCGGSRLMLHQAEEPAGPESLVYFRVDDIHAACDSLETRGVNFTHAPHRVHRHADGTEEWMAFFEDPEGRPLAIMSSPRPA